MKKLKPLTYIKHIKTAFCTGMLMFFGLMSCQKVINIDLNSTSPQLVVEAIVTDRPGPYLVKLSKSVSFSEITEIPPVTGATVEISDSTGINETLTEIQSGLYKASLLKGVPGHKYRLTISTDGKVFESVSVMPFPAGDLTLSLKRVVENGHSPGGISPDQPLQYAVSYEINDPAEFKNYYRFIAYRGNRMISSRRVFSDQYHNGKLIADDFNLRDTVNFVPGDTVKIELQNIDMGTYNFFRTIRDGTGGLSFLSASPSNPISNISNNGLGYFCACSVTDRILIIQGK